METEGKWDFAITLGSILMMIVGAFKLLTGIIGLFRDEWLLLGYKGYMLVDITGMAIWWLLVGALLLFGGMAAHAGQDLGEDRRYHRRLSGRDLRVLHAARHADVVHNHARRSTSWCWWPSSNGRASPSSLIEQGAEAYREPRGISANMWIERGAAEGRPASIVSGLPLPAYPAVTQRCGQ